MRTETDSLGALEVPADAYWGISTQRAVENFPVSGRPIGGLRKLIWAFGAIKAAAAQANAAQGLLDPDCAEAITVASREVMGGELDQQFIVDRIQGGAGTSTNMNANEVVANRALELLGFAKGEYTRLDPIDHVNRSQSTNDTYPTAAKLALHEELVELCAEHELLAEAFASKGREFATIVKVGRTQLQDAVPMTLGQEFGAFADTLREDRLRLLELLPHLREINLGATAIGTGITASDAYRCAVVAELALLSGVPVVSAENLVEATSDTGVFMLLSGVVKRAAMKLSKICNDLRLLSSGPQAGFGEIHLPAVQAGSSIMPGKVNPVIPEMVNQVAFRIAGADTTVTMAAEAGQLQLNAFEPVMVDALLESLQWLRTACRLLRERCAEGITANEPLLARRMDESLSVATALTPLLGYAVTAKLIKEASAQSRSIVELVLEHQLLSREQIEAALSLAALTGVAS
ncbi:aspartate ammonia-lyase [Glutamicibacter mysorens]|uniref:aspartate ammonia-lyase n=1 Tax=Glutamicibacter mysorens TaxID=257984 RepID=UPI0020C7151D|nr:aspartate ammonia-lyase [Glutamicibacter mysorens]UTM45983.1 aspartate ammonia-lyase [Glutamicibacter mysorens]